MASSSFSSLWIFVAAALAVGTRASFAAPSVLPGIPADAPPQVVSQQEQPRLVTSTLRLQLWSEQRSGVFFAGETMKTRTPLVFSARLFDEGDDDRPAEMVWTMEDADGKLIWRRVNKARTVPGAFIQTRQLFEVPKLGSYTLRVRALARGGEKNRKHDAEVTLPISIVEATRGGFRPRSYFALTAPLNASDDTLDFYARLGARVLRSPFPANLGANNSATIERQMQQRLLRRMTTWGVLSLDAMNSLDDGTALDGAGGSESLQQRIGDMTARYRAVTRWELAGSAAEGTLPALSSVSTQAQGVQWLRPARKGRDDLNGWNGVVASDASISAFTGDNFSAMMRSLMWQRAHSAGERDEFFLTQNLFALTDAERFPNAERFSSTQKWQTPRDAANDLVMRYLMGILGNVTSYSQTLDGQNENLSQRQARGAAFSTLNGLLEDATVESDLFPTSPLLWGVALRTPSRHIAALWLDEAVSNGRKAQLVVPLAGARVLDVFGNEIASSKNSELRVPLGSGPVYVLSEHAVNTQFAARAWSQARLNGIQTMAVRALPLTQTPPQLPAGKLDKAMRETLTAAKNASLRVQVQNLSNAAQSGTLRVFAPEGFKLETDSQNYKLQAGEARILRFPLSRWQARRDGEYPLTLETRSGKETHRWKDRVLIASAQPMGAPVQLDGDLSEWSDAAWMQLRGGKSGEARLALRYDASRLYIAARVDEKTLQARRDDTTYRFWNGFDALQLAFGLRDEPQLKPSRAPFRDTDYGFLLAPFENAPFDNVAGRDVINGRVLRLWNNTLPFDETRDETRWGGIVPGSQCLVRRDDTRGVTTYEAVLPLSEMPMLRPSYRGERDIPVRFNWVLHRDDAPALQWSRETEAFPWWRNPASMLPSHEVLFAAQTPLGFMPAGNANFNVQSPPPGGRVSTPPTRPDTAPQQLPNLPPASVSPAAPASPPAAPLLPPAAINSGTNLPPLPPSPPQ